MTRQSLGELLWEPYGIKLMINAGKCFLIDAITFNGLEIYFYLFLTSKWSFLVCLEIFEKFKKSLKIFIKKSFLINFWKIFPENLWKNFPGKLSGQTFPNNPNFFFKNNFPWNVM